MGKKILIVDDAELFLKIEESFLNRENVKIYTASSGIQALQRAVEYEPDLILLDLNMPDLQGDEICAKLKSQEKFRNVPILIVTSEEREHAFQSSIKAGCDGFIMKPIEKNIFLSKIREHLAIADRKYPRILTNFLCTFTIADIGGAGAVNNLSEGGAHIQTSVSLAIGASGDLRFTLPNRGEPISCNAVIRWKVDSGDTNKYGLEFLSLSEHDRSAIKRLVELSLGQSQ